MPKAKLFTKSAFKVALECPWKLYYYRHPEIYANASLEDDFLKSLAQGGFQVGELAKIYCKVDNDADLKDIKGYDEAIARTNELMKRENVTIAEAAFRWNNLFVRVDILEKRGNKINLIEVKAKSYDSTNDKLLTAGKSRVGGFVNNDFKEYIYDVAFQKYVLTQAMNGCGYSIHAYLMLADKSTTTDINGLNQLFKIKEEDTNIVIEVMPGAVDKMKGSTEVLNRWDVDYVCDDIIDGKTMEQGQNEEDKQVEKAEIEYQKELEKYENSKRKRKVPEKKKVEHINNYWMQGMKFKEFVEMASKVYCSNDRYPGNPILCGNCFKCEFHKKNKDEKLQDGKSECWKNVADFGKKPMVENLNGTGLSSKRGDWVREGKYFMEDIKDDIIKVIEKAQKKKAKDGLNYCERQRLQIGMETKDQTILDDYSPWVNSKGNIYLDIDGLKKEMAKWIFPLHMIDFETTAVAIPFYKGRHPYEQIAFQFSHHIIDKDENGKIIIEHKGQYINDDVTKFPNFEFVRKLKEQLDGDEGTIFRYSHHENTILCEIARQIKYTDELKEDEKKELRDFIKSITHNEGKNGDKAYDDSPRDMVDLCEIVRQYFYNVDEMHGSNSIKQVLPAVLNCSDFLKQKYSEPIYGDDIKSLNITSKDKKAWITYNDKGDVESPYHLLDDIGQLIGMTNEQISRFESMQSYDNEEDDSMNFKVNNGGGALTAYSKLMFCQDNKIMDKALREALYRYCELDTMSMVFIWEYFNDECKDNKIN